MNRYMPRIRLALMVLTLALLSACGDKTEPASAGDAPATASVVEENEESVETPTSEPESTESVDDGPSEVEAPDDDAPPAVDTSADDAPQPLDEDELLDQFLELTGLEPTPELASCVKGQLDDAGMTISEPGGADGDGVFIALIRCKDADELYEFFGSATEAEAAAAGVDLAEAECALDAFIRTFQQGPISDALTLMDSVEPPPELIAAMASTCDISEEAALLLLNG